MPDDQSTDNSSNKICFPKNTFLIYTLIAFVIILGVMTTLIYAIKSNFELRLDEVRGETRLKEKLETNDVTEQNVMGSKTDNNGKGNSGKGGGSVKYLSCSDSDDGKNYDIYGTVGVDISYQGNTSTEYFNDNCNDSSTLEEYYCGRKNRLATSVYTCAYGCSGGKCLSKPIDKCIDKDGDGYGNPASTTCKYGSLDCNDNNTTVHPSAVEICGNGIDEDCNGSDLTCPVTCNDKDGDGYGNPASEACTYTTLDCNDNSNSVYPGATEICGNGVDEDCSGSDKSCGGTTQTGAYRAFSDDSYWNRPIPANAPIDPYSDLYIQDAQNSNVSSPPYIRLTGAPDMSDADAWSYPIYWATSSDPVYSIDPALYGSTINVRIPYGATPQSGSDNGLHVYDLSNDAVIELWHADYDSVNNKWTADSTTRYFLSSNGLASGVSGSNNSLNFGHRGIPTPIRAVRFDEIQSGVILHRLECFWHATGKPSGTSVSDYYWPMNGYESGKGGIVPEGLVLRLKPSVNIDSKTLSPTAKIIAKTMQDYGCIIGDNDGGTKNSIKLERGSAKWAQIDPDLSLSSLSVFQWSDYEFVKGGYNPTY